MTRGQSTLSNERFFRHPTVHWHPTGRFLTSKRLSDELKRYEMYPKSKVPSVAILRRQRGGCVQSRVWLDQASWLRIECAGTEKQRVQGSVVGVLRWFQHTVVHVSEQVKLRGRDKVQLEQASYIATPRETNETKENEHKTYCTCHQKPH